MYTCWVSVFTEQPQIIHIHSAGVRQENSSPCVRDVKLEELRIPFDVLWAKQHRLHAPQSTACDSNCNGGVCWKWIRLVVHQLLLIQTVTKVVHFATNDLLSELGSPKETHTRLWLHNVGWDKSWWTERNQLCYLQYPHNIRRDSKTHTWPREVPILAPSLEWMLAPLQILRVASVRTRAIQMLFGSRWLTVICIQHHISLTITVLVLDTVRIIWRIGLGILSGTLRWLNLCSCIWSSQSRSAARASRSHLYDT